MSMLAPPYSSACFNHIKNAVDGGIVLFTEADLNSPVGEAGIYSVAELCKGLPDSCSLILNNQDRKNQQDADYNLHNPILIAERAKDARYILSHIGIDTTYMSDKETVDKVNEIGLMISAEIVGAGKGKGTNNTSSVKINKGQQNKHIEGTNEFKTAGSSGDQRSILKVSPESLLPNVGKGKQIGNVKVGLPSSKERINFG